MRSPRGGSLSSPRHRRRHSTQWVDPPSQVPAPEAGRSDASTSAGFLVLLDLRGHLEARLSHRKRPVEWDPDGPISPLHSLKSFPKCQPSRTAGPIVLASKPVRGLASAVIVSSSAGPWGPGRGPSANSRGSQVPYQTLPELRASWALTVPWKGRGEQVMWPHGRDPAPQGPALLRTLRANSAVRSRRRHGGGWGTWERDGDSEAELEHVNTHAHTHQDPTVRGTRAFTAASQLEPWAQGPTCQHGPPLPVWVTVSGHGRRPGLQSDRRLCLPGWASACGGVWTSLRCPGGPASSLKSVQWPP